MPLAGRVASEAVSASLIGFTFLDRLPSIAAGIGAVWYIIMIWECEWGKRQRARIRKWLTRHV